MPPAPVNTTYGEVASLHTVVVPVMLAVGFALTVTTALPLAVLEQFASDTPVNKYVNVPGVPVGTAILAVSKLPVVVLVNVPPPFNV